MAAHRPNKSGKLFEYEISRSLKWFCQKHPHCWQERIPDYKDYIKAFASTFSHIAVPKRPADYQAVYQGQAYFFEAKSTSNYRFYNTRWVRQEQIETLLKLHDAGAKAFLVFRRVNRSDPAAWWMTITDYLKMVEEVDMVGIKWEHFDKYSHRLEGFIYESERYWVLDPMFQPSVSTM